MVESSVKELHTHNEQVGRNKVPCLIPLVGLKKSVFSPFTRMEIEEKVMQDMMRNISLGGTLKK